MDIPYRKQRVRVYHLRNKLLLTRSSSLLCMLVKGNYLAYRQTSIEREEKEKEREKKKFGRAPVASNIVWIFFFAALLQFSKRVMASPFTFCLYNTVPSYITKQE